MGDQMSTRMFSALLCLAATAQAQIVDNGPIHHATRYSTVGYDDVVLSTGYVGVMYTTWQRRYDDLEAVSKRVGNR